MLSAFVFALLTAIVASNATPAPPSDLLPTVRAVNDDFIKAVTHHDAALAAAGYAEDGVWTNGGTLHLRGRSQIKAFLAKRFAHKYEFIKGSCTSNIEWSDTQSALEVGSCSTTLKTAKGVKTSGGRFATVWRRQTDGTWKIAANYTP